MFGIETDVRVNRIAKGIEFSFGRKPEIKHFNSEADAQRGIGRERVLWTAAFVISAGLTIAGLNAINTQVSQHNYHFP